MLLKVWLVSMLILLLLRSLDKEKQKSHPIVSTHQQEPTTDHHECAMRCYNTPVRY